MRRVVFLAALGLAVNGCVASSSGKAAFPVANTHLFSEQELVETKALFQEIAGPEYGFEGPNRPHDILIRVGMMCASLGKCIRSGEVLERL